MEEENWDNPTCRDQFFFCWMQYRGPSLCPDKSMNVKFCFWYSSTTIPRSLAEKYFFLKLFYRTFLPHIHQRSWFIWMPLWSYLRGHQKVDLLYLYQLRASRPAVTIVCLILLSGNNPEALEPVHMILPPICYTKTSVSFLFLFLLIIEFNFSSIKKHAEPLSCFVHFENC